MAHTRIRPSVLFLDPLFIGIIGSEKPREVEITIRKERRTVVLYRIVIDPHMGVRVPLELMAAPSLTIRIRPREKKAAKRTGDA